jgi:hypothetical protein
VILLVARHSVFVFGASGDLDRFAARDRSRIGNLSTWLDRGRSVPQSPSDDESEPPSVRKVGLRDGGHGVCASVRSFQPAGERPRIIEVLTNESATFARPCDPQILLIH